MEKGTYPLSSEHLPDFVLGQTDLGRAMAFANRSSLHRRFVLFFVCHSTDLDGVQ